jgi:hypothetical protein
MAVAFGHTRVDRAVDEAEYQQILSDGKFRVGPGSVDGKYFADSIESAQAHGGALNGCGAYHNVVADVADNAPSVLRWPNLDGRRPARFIHIDDLNDVRPRPIEVTEK